MSLTCGHEARKELIQPPQYRIPAAEVDLLKLCAQVKSCMGNG